MIILNKNYYKKLLEEWTPEYQIKQENKFINLNTSFIEKVLDSKDIDSFFIQLPKLYNDLQNLFDSFFRKIAEYQFLELNKKPEYKEKGELKKITTGKYYKISETPSEENKYKYKLTETSKRGKTDPYSTFKNYEDLNKDYYRVDKKMDNKTFESYKNFVKEIFGLNCNIPSSFSSKSILICSESYWNNSEYKYKIPVKYINKNGVDKSSVAIDNLFYLAPDYSTAFNYILKKSLKEEHFNINNIFLFEFKESDLIQLIQDKNKYNDKFKFNIFGVTLQEIESKTLDIWTWFKDEIDLVNSL